MDTTRPDYIACIRSLDGAFSEHTPVWCGRVLETMEWRFGGIDHAANNARSGGRMVACPECVAAIAKVFAEASNG